VGLDSRFNFSVAGTGSGKALAAGATDHRRFDDGNLARYAITGCVGAGGEDGSSSAWSASRRTGRRLFGRPLAATAESGVERLEASAAAKM
jgi:hypothetical protein